ncbi:discoidin domain-containing protein [Phycicoccus ginsengisoli]
MTLTGDKATPYVLAPLTGTTRPAPVYGTGTLLHDPGFNAGNLTAWDPSGGAHVERTATGDNVAVLGSKDSGVSQGVQGLTPGARYQLSADVEIGPGERRPVTLRLSGKDTKAVNAFDTTPVRNTMAADAKKGTWSQRAAVDFTAPATGNVAVQLRAVAGSARVALDDVRLVRVTTVAVPTPVSGDSTQPSRAGGDIVAAENFEGSQPAWGPFVKGDAGGATDPRTSISQLHDPYSQKGWKNTHAPFNAGSLAGKGTDDVVSGNHSLKSHEENSGLVYRTVPATVPFVAGHSYTVRFRYQNSLASQFAWVTGADTVAGGAVRSKDLTVEPMPQALDTASYDRTFTAGCGDAWVGLRRTGSSGGADFVLDDFTVTDHGPAAGGAACGTVSAPASASLSPGTANRYTTSFTNNDSERVTNVAMSLGALPDGWTVQVAEQGGNLFAGVDPGQTVRTTWLLTPPAAAAGTSADLRPTATYFHRCTTKSVSTSSTLTVATRAMVPTESMTATADSEEKNAGPSEGPVANVLDGDLGTIWHTQYDPTVTDYPHWVRLALDATSTVDGFGYQDRQGGGPNGRVKDYTVSVSQDGASWTRVASGTLKDVPEVQVVSFPAVQARYVRFDALNALNGQPFAAAAEMRVYGTSPTPVTGWAPAPRPDDTACTP